ncbi:MAG: 16S rRNA (uracil(1498)-N(3))-methyltransferase [Gammaproteobacteria bacterium]|nr:16S rRNA (uracil(1498)-N(3))-methyltransferase [Gammaproteobacteria bacterium]|tara:strand:+ start:102 stop:833 length:732 start_codon:yes stop_codon:yes gene_type:complete
MITRLFVSGNLFNGAKLKLDGDRAKYLGKVLRARVGNTFIIFDGSGLEWSAKITQITNNNIYFELGIGLDPHTESPLEIHLIQGISRGDRMDFVMQKATELGIKSITPVLTDYGMVKLNSERAQKRRDHWQKIANSACEQSGRTRQPTIDMPLSLEAYLNKPPIFDIKIILSPNASVPFTQIPAPKNKICILIGPEGGFSKHEYAHAKAIGFQEASLGPRILRTESAAISAISILQAKWGDLR